MTSKKFTRVEAFATANAFVFDFGARHKHRYNFPQLAIAGLFNRAGGI